MSGGSALVGLALPVPPGMSAGSYNRVCLSDDHRGGRERRLQ